MENKFATINADLVKKRTFTRGNDYWKDFQNRAIDKAGERAEITRDSQPNSEGNGVLDLRFSDGTALLEVPKIWVDFSYELPRGILNNIKKMQMERDKTWRNYPPEENTTMEDVQEWMKQLRESVPVSDVYIKFIQTLHAWLIWQDETFPQATPLSKAKHMQKEVKELIAELELKSDESRHSDTMIEYADCLVLLMGSIHHYVNQTAKTKSFVATLMATEMALSLKLSINKKREWNKPDKDGVVTHKKSKK